MQIVCGKDFGAYFSGCYLGVNWNEGGWLSLTDGRLFTSNGTETEREYDVVAVVLLRPDVTFNKNENNTWILEC